MNAQTRPHHSRLGAALALACITLFATGPLTALADPPTVPAPLTLESRVSLADLDLSTPEGTRAAHKRLRKKAESLCRQLWDSTSASFRWTYAACVTETFANTIQQLNAPELVSADRARAKP